MNIDLVFVGYWTLGVLGLFTLAAVSAVALVVTRHYAWEAWKELTAIYRLESIRYYFQRMEKEGTHCFKVSAAQTECKEPTE